MRRPSPRSWSPVLAVVGLQCLAAGISLGLQRPSAPILWTDEAAYLGIAVELAGRADTIDLSGGPVYSPGLSFLIAPLLAVSEIDPWRAGIVVNTIAFVVIGVALFGLARTGLRLQPWPAAAVAAVGGTTASTTLQLSRTWVEVVLAAVVVSWAWVLHAHVLRARWSTACGLVAAAWLAYAVHHRSIALVGVTFVALAGTAVIEARTGHGVRVRLRASLVASVPSASLLLALLWLRSFEASLVDDLFGGSATAAERIDVGERVFLLSTYAKVLGQSWAVQVGTLGLAGVALAASVRRDILRTPTGRWRVLVVLAFGGTLAISALFLAKGGRTDQFVYERYVGVFTPLLAMVGAADLVRRTDRAGRLVVPAIASTAVLFVCLVLVAPVDVFDRQSVPMTIPALTGWDMLLGRGRTRSSALDAGAIAVLVSGLVCGLWWLWHRRPVLAAGTAVATSLAVVVAGATWFFAPWFNVFEQSSVAAADFLEQEQVDRVGVIGPLRPETLSSLQYRADYVELVEIEAATCPRTDYFVAPVDVDLGFRARGITDLPPFGGRLYEASCRTGR